MADKVMSALEAAEAKEVLLEQERALRFPERFGAAEALELGIAAARLADEFDEAYTVTITREPDGEVAFQWLGEGRGARNLTFAAGKRAAARAAGHASPWTQLDTIASGEPLDALWAKVPDVVPSCGAFPLRVGEDWVATSR